MKQNGSVVKLISSSVEENMLPDLRCRLLQWYRQHQRKLPWRAESDPYKVWISEVMSQQTQLSTIIPSYQRFIALFPDVRSLASASLDELLKVWQGLGYYRRVQNLHQAAQIIVQQYGGELPTSYQALRRLPGFGDYIAAAVTSIAFGAVIAAIDGNVRRVLARFFTLSGDVRRGAPARRLRKLAAWLIDESQPAEWTQALMELGAIICTPSDPNCSRCPWQMECQGRALGQHLTLPEKIFRHSLPHYEVTAAIIRNDVGQLLIARRPLKKMLGGLWEFPGGKCLAEERLEVCLQREIQEELGLEIIVGEAIACIKHRYTHFRITLHAFLCTVANGEPRPLEVAECRWVCWEELPQFAFPVSDQKIIRALARRVEGDPHQG